MKKLWRPTIALILILAVLFIPVATAEEAPIDKYTGSASILSIPDTLDGYAVTAIGNEAFRLCQNLLSVSIPDGVTSIGDRAFYGCWFLSHITIPDSVTSIGDGAFEACALTLIVSRDSWAEEWCKDNGIDYIYSDAHN